MRPIVDGPVLVGFDGSPLSERALHVAASEAESRNVALRVLLIHESDGHQPPGSGRPHRSDLERLLEEACAGTVRHHPALGIDADMTTGLPAQALVDESVHSCLTVVGRRGTGNPGGLSAGSVCVQVVTWGHGPIMVVGDVPGMTDVIVGVNTQAPAHAAIEFAFAEAVLRGVDLHAIYASHRRPDGEMFSAPEYRAGDDERARGALAEALAGWSARYPDLKVTYVVEHDHVPSAALLAASGRAGLVVVGPHEQAGGPGLPLGTVAATLTHHGHAPIAIVHPHG